MPVTFRITSRITSTTITTVNSKHSTARRRIFHIDIRKGEMVRQLQADKSMAVVEWRNLRRTCQLGNISKALPIQRRERRSSFNLVKAKVRLQI